MILDKVYNNRICKDKSCRMKNCFKSSLRNLKNPQDESFRLQDDKTTINPVQLGEIESSSDAEMSDEEKELPCDVCYIL